MLIFDKKFELKRVVALFFIIVLTVNIYWPGLKGGFLFDDLPNLKGLGDYAYFYDKNEAINFIKSGFAGPTGRPVSLASFIPQAYAWDNDPFQFKIINLYIHLICGLLLYWATYILLKNYQYDETKATWIALLSSSIWMLHPFLVSTVLYTVQRMAQLSLLFTLCSIVGYLKGRLYLQHNNFAAYSIMSVSIGLGTILATYSKENGALIPLIILLIEFLNPNHIKPSVYWRAIFLWVPSLVLGYILARKINFSSHPWENRNFNQIERVLTEFRIIIDYLKNLFIPKIELHGLYQDGYIISKSFFDPMTTLYSFILIVFLISSAFYLKNKFPLYSLAILCFFISHLMESTVIGLELYFEHRNYSAAIFIFLPIVLILSYIYEKHSKMIAITGGSFLILFLSFFSYQRSVLWSDTDKLKLFWAGNSPDSPRAHYEIVMYLLKNNKIYEANAFLEKSLIKFPDSSLLTMQLLLQKVQYGLATHKDFDQAISFLAKQKFDAQTYKAVNVLMELVTVTGTKYDLENTLSFYLKLDDVVRNNNKDYWKISPYLKGKIYLKLGQPDLALSSFSEALGRVNNFEAGMNMTAELAAAGYQKEALQMIENVDTLFQRKYKNNIKYKNEIERLKFTLMKEVT